MTNHAYALHTDDALTHQGPCPECGASHESSIEAILVADDFSLDLIQYLQSRQYQNLALIADTTTWQKQGEPLYQAIRNTFNVTYHIFEDPHLVADQVAVQALTHFLEGHPKLDYVLAIGSGTLNDLTREVTTHLGCPYGIVATANSMDGYASSSSPLIVGKMKITYPGQVPTLIAATPDVLRHAPADMTAAGIGDTLGKHNCLLDWRLGHVIHEEMLCPNVFGLVEHSLDQLPETIHGIQANTSQAHVTLFDSLLTVGVAMSFHGNSRPASGSEHHLSHFWEMQLLLQDRPPIHHGIKVAVGGRYANWLYHYLSTQTPDFYRARESARQRDVAAERAAVISVYGAAADDVLAISTQAGHFDIDAQLNRLDRIESRWADIQRILTSAIPNETYTDLMSAANIPLTPSGMGLERTLVTAALRYCWHLRDRYTIFTLLFDLGLLDQATNDVVDALGA